MARLFVLLSLLEEANSLDLYNSRRQAQQIRAMRLFNRNKDYVNVYRLSEELINQLEEDIKFFIRKPQRRHRGLSVRIKLLCTLSFLASGSYQRIIGQNINTFLSQPTASRCICEVVETLNHPTIISKYIKFPQNAEERLALKERFYEKFKIPGVIGCVDGTFVTIVRPTENEERYYCRKGNHARNVQLYTDADLNIIHVDATYGGATHDSFIFNNSDIKNHLEELVGAGETVYLLGDSGYAQRSYLMTPIPNAVEGTPEEYYNKLHATARNTVERTIDRLKGRFRCLLVHRVLHYHPDTVGKIVIACCVLHNICNRAGLPAPTLDSHDEEEEANFRAIARVSAGRQLPLTHSQSELTIGQSSRDMLVNQLWRSRRE
ncbi:putative nuclease HARBI1 [Galleria mellonella]|uniref:Nuclease HARBI1 n=1 Tax=Galleria mellonella TaxID=7137 RepID=A0ABM3MHL7_GALME|nr:putative nuclease HARBI1 [Galleria mellonella]